MFDLLLTLENPDGSFFWLNGNLYTIFNDECLVIKGTHPNSEIEFAGIPKGMESLSELLEYLELLAL